MNKVALFDFCETLANFQTADAYVDYVRNHTTKKSVGKWKKFHEILKKIYVIKILARLLPKSSINKRIYSLQLKGMTVNELDSYANEYYLNVIRPNLIKPVVELLQQLKDEGYRIVLVSGGYGIYLKYFADEFQIAPENVIATNLKIKNGVCTGTFVGKDCLFEEKVKRLNLIFRKSEIYARAYSDSKSDLPMLEWADEGIVVRRKDKRK